MSIETQLQRQQEINHRCGERIRNQRAEIKRLQAALTDPDAHVNYTHGASGMCCELRREAVGRAEIAEAKVERLQSIVVRLHRSCGMEYADMSQGSAETCSKMWARIEEAAEKARAS